MNLRGRRAGRKVVVNIRWRKFDEERRVTPFLPDRAIRPDRLSPMLHNVRVLRPLFAALHRGEPERVQQQCECHPHPHESGNLSDAASHWRGWLEWRLAVGAPDDQSTAPPAFLPTETPALAFGGRCCIFCWSRSTEEQVVCRGHSTSRSHSNQRRQTAKSNARTLLLHTVPT